jgi:hypothetical protein
MIVYITNKFNHQLFRSPIMSGKITLEQMICSWYHDQEYKWENNK